MRLGPLPVAGGLAAAAAGLLVLAALAPRETPEGMLPIPGGTFWMGTARGLPDEGPPHPVTVEPFWMDRTEVTNTEFRAFVEATGYRTESEREGWSGVFDPATHRWTTVTGADWRHPEGPGSSIAERGDFPVVHVSWDDANAYASWAGKRLPTEAEWEWAARGGRLGTLYPWGNRLTPGGRFMANTWQGRFPERDRGSDGFRAVAPAGQFPPNGYGLVDMVGNVWEWTADWFAPFPPPTAHPVPDPRGPATGTAKVIRGGSWLCSANYCAGYRVAARQHTPTDSGLNNLGFRCVRSRS